MSSSDIPFPPRAADEEEKRKWEVSKLQHEIADLRGLVRRFGGVLGVVTALLSIYIAYRSVSEAKVSADLAEVRQAKAEIAESKSNDRKAEAEKKFREAELSEKQALEIRDTALKDANDASSLAQQKKLELRSAQQELAAIRKQVEESKQTAERIARSQPGNEVKAAAAEQAATLDKQVQEAVAVQTSQRNVPRVFVFPVNAVQRARAQQVLDPVIKEIIPDVRWETVPGRREDKTVVRYFRDEKQNPEDARLAQEVVKNLSKHFHLSPDQIRTSYVIDKDSEGTGPRLQIWLRKSEFTPVVHLESKSGLDSQALKTLTIKLKDLGYRPDQEKEKGLGLPHPRITHNPEDLDVAEDIKTQMEAVGYHDIELVAQAGPRNELFIYTAD